jgi:hypothetical protein
MDSLAKGSDDTMRGGAQSSFQSEFLLCAECITSIPTSCKHCLLTIWSGCISMLFSLTWSEERLAFWPDFRLLADQLESLHSPELTGRCCFEIRGMCLLSFQRSAGSTCLAKSSCRVQGECLFIKVIYMLLALFAENLALSHCLYLMTLYVRCRGTVPICTCCTCAPGWPARWRWS